MKGLRKLKLILVAGASICALAACQSNTAGKPGYQPMNCAGPGSSCSRL